MPNFLVIFVYAESADADVRSMTMTRSTDLQRPASTPADLIFDRACGASIRNRYAQKRDEKRKKKVLLNLFVHKKFDIDYGCEREKKKKKK